MLAITWQNSKFLVCVLALISLQACAAGRYPSKPSHAEYVEYQYLKSRVEILARSNPLCDHTVSKTETGAFWVEQVGQDFLLLRKQDGEKLLVPLSALCFSL